MRGLISALRTLTLIPVPGREADSLAGAVPFFPVVGALVGGATAAFGWGVAWLTDDWTLGAAATMVLLEVLLTGALHVDGLADAADSLGAMGDRDKALRLMKDSRIGTYGVAAIVCLLLTKFAVYDRLLQYPGMWLAVLSCFAVSRFAMAHLSVALPYVRAEGGTGEPFVSGAGPWHLAFAGLATLGVCCAAGPTGLMVFLLGATLAAAVARVCLRRYGGATGDLLGAAGEIVLVGTLALTALAAKPLAQWLTWRVGP